MYGWRAKIGLISPMGESIEHAFHIHAPEGVTFASTKIGIPDHAEDIDSISVKIKEAAAAYQDYDAHLIVSAYTTGSYVHGLSWDQTCMDQISHVSGIPSLTANTAVLEAFHALNAKRIAVLSPYSDEIRELEQQFLLKNELDVISTSSLNMAQFAKNKYLGFEDAGKYFLYQSIRQFQPGSADALYISGMGLTTLEMINALEVYFEMPVVTCQQATLWGALRHCRVGAKMDGLGKLLTL